jgi:uncharacterized phage protein gp47/JayE
MASLTAVISSTGVEIPTYPEILAELQIRYRAIFGADIYIEPDSQDGQFLAIFAQALYDMNTQVAAVYNSFSPSYAVGNGLSSVVKINGIARRIASTSTAVGTCVGQAGTVITNGSVKDSTGNIWNLPASVTIPLAGEITVTVTAATAGALLAPAGDINIINTPTYGWQSFVNTADAVAGAAVETDAELRVRQTASTGLPASTPMGALYGNLFALTGVTRLALYENTGDTPDSNGLTAHSICAVVEGGTAEAIATTIGAKKTPGAATYGGTSGTYTDPITGIEYEINYEILDAVAIKVAVTGSPLSGYSAASIPKIQAAVAAYINGLGIDSDVQFSRMWSPAYLNGLPEGQTYEVTAITIAKGLGAPGTSDIAIDFNQAASCLTTDVVVTIA